MTRLPEADLLFDNGPVFTADGLTGWLLLPGFQDSHIHAV